VTARSSSAVTTDPLDVTAHERAVADPAAGAVFSFAGVVRDHDGGKGVLELEYEAHPTAGEVLAKIVADFAAEPSAYAVSVSHRVGRLNIGDVALAAAVSTAHRAEAFDLCARLVDEVKARLPVWKRQVFANGEEEWVNCP